MEKLTKLYSTAILVVVSTLISGFVLLKLWEWIIVSTFHIQIINLPQSIGIMLIIGYLRPKRKSDKSEEFSFEKLNKQFLEFVAYALITLSLGWFITLFL